MPVSLRPLSQGQARRPSFSLILLALLLASPVATESQLVAQIFDLTAATPRGADEIAPLQATPVLVVGAAADIQYEDREPGPFPHDIRRWYNTSNIRLDEIIRAWNGREDLDIVMHLGDLINAQWQSYDVMLDYADGTDYDPDLLTFRDLNAPSYQVLGNHEFNNISDDPHPLGHDDLHVRQRLGLANNIGYYAFAPADGYRFLVLDDQVPEANPTRPGSSFGLGERRSAYFQRQMQWARRVVADAWRAGEKVVMYEHYPMAKYYNNKPLSEWEAALADIIETFPNVVAHFSGHYHGGPGKVKDGVLFDTLAGTVSANPDLDQNIWYELEFYDDHVVVDQFGENFYLEADQDDKQFTFRDHTLEPNCREGESCLEVALADFNSDGDVDGTDMQAWQDHYGSQANVALVKGVAEGDLDIDGGDFMVWQRNFGSGAAATAISSQAIPEPSTALLLAGAAIGLLLANSRSPRLSAISSRPSACEVVQ